MSQTLCVLLVAKVPTLERLTRGELDGLCDNCLVERSYLEEEREAHYRTVAAVEAELARHLLRKRLVHEIRADDGLCIDLAVTVGGDGTVFTVHRVLDRTPLIAVNSDPHRSVGHYTRCRADCFAALLDAWRSGHAPCQDLPRLQAEIGTAPAELILNDCLFTNQSPAAMSRYLLRTPELIEAQASSGVWVATAAGASGAIKSAGVTWSGDDERPALLFKVREPYQGRRPCACLEGLQAPPRWLELLPAMPGLMCYVDGCHTARHVPPGVAVRFSAHPQPLRLIAGDGSSRIGASTQTPAS